MNADAIAQAHQLYGAAVGERKADYYVPKFIVFDGFNPSHLSWNWCAFFATLPWMLYRRMFGFAAAYFFAIPIVVGVTTIFVWIGDPGLAPYINTAIALFAFFGFVPMYANAMYHVTVARRIAKVQAQTQDFEEQVRLLSQSKSTSTVGLVVGVALVGALFVARMWPEAERYNAKAILSQAEQGMLRTGWLRAEIETYYLEHQRWPHDGAELGVDASGNGKYISAITVVDGTIRVEYGNEASMAISGKVLVLEPVLVQSVKRIDWMCREAEDAALRLPKDFWPDVCLDQAVGL